LGDAVAVPAVRAGDVVVVPQVHADAGGRGLFARVQVHEPGDLPGRELRVHALLELADRAHGAVGLQELCFRQLRHLTASFRANRPQVKSGSSRYGGPLPRTLSSVRSTPWRAANESVAGTSMVKGPQRSSVTARSAAENSCSRTHAGARVSVQACNAVLRRGTLFILSLSCNA